MKHTMARIVLFTYFAFLIIGIANTSYGREAMNYNIKADIKDVDIFTTDILINQETPDYHKNSAFLVCKL